MQRLVVEAIKKEESAANKFRVLLTTLLRDVKIKANKFSTFRADLHENHMLIDNVVKQRDSYIEELLKDILIPGISQQEIKMMNNAEMSLWAKMVNLTFKAMAHKLFLEDDFSVSESQLGFIADTLFLWSESIRIANPASP